MIFMFHIIVPCFSYTIETFGMYILHFVTMYYTQQLLMEFGGAFRDKMCYVYITFFSYASRYEMTRSTRATYTVGVGYSRALHYSKVVFKLRDLFVGFRRSCCGSISGWSSTSSRPLTRKCSRICAVANRFEYS